MDTQTNDTASAPETEPRRGRGASWVSWLLVVIFVVYPLSSGPVVRLWTALGLSPDPLLAVYTPLVFLAFYFPGFRGLFIWYLALWKANLIS